MCQSHIVSHGRNSVMWQWQCHVSLLDVKSLYICYFVSIWLQIF